jgi:hypothetical protein
MLVLCSLIAHKAYAQLLFALRQDPFRDTQTISIFNLRTDKYKTRSKQKVQEDDSPSAKISWKKVEPGLIMKAKYM